MNIRNATELNKVVTRVINKKNQFLFPGPDQKRIQRAKYTDTSFSRLPDGGSH